MARPTTKDSLLDACEREHHRLLALLQAMPESIRENADAQWPIQDRSRNPRDVLAHLHAWHLLMLGWYRAGMAGDRPPMPAAGFTWRQTPQLNDRIWEDHAGWSYPQAMQAYLESRERCLALIRAHTDEELFTKRRYPWTGSTSLGQYLVSATSSHDVWAVKTLKAIQAAAQAGQ